MEDFWGVGKWVLIVFVTGLIAGFGKIMASWIVKRGKKAPESTEISSSGPLPPSQSPAEEKLHRKAAKQQAKIEKKLAKEELKRRKKAEED